MLEADELVAKHRKTKGDTDELHAHLNMSIEKDSGKEPDRRNCKYFEIHGQCRYGDKCKFHHIESPGKKPKKVKGDKEKGADKEKEPEKAKEKGDKGAGKEGDKQFRGICKYYPKGTCAHGDQCKWKHVMPANKEDGQEEPPQVIAKGIWIMMQSTGDDGPKVPFYHK
eukprot:886592-Lingulodinium_polyedra.AAC.1